MYDVCTMLVIAIAMSYEQQLCGCSSCCCLMTRTRGHCELEMELDISARHNASNNRINASMACRKCDSRRLTERFSHDASHDQIHFLSFKSYEYRDSGIFETAKPFSDLFEQYAGSSEAVREQTTATVLVQTQKEASAGSVASVALI